jgi:hypothetical protein
MSRVFCHSATAAARAMDKLKPTGQNLVLVFNTRSGCVYAMHLFCYEAILPNLELKTWDKQLLGYLPQSTFSQDVTARVLKF